MSVPTISHVIVNMECGLVAVHVQACRLATLCGKSPSTSLSHDLQLVSTPKLLDLVTCGTKRPSTYNYTQIVYIHIIQSPKMDTYC